MEIAFYNFADIPERRVEVCLENELMVWCDGEDYYVSGDRSAYRKFGGNEQEVAHALGEALLQMIGGYR